MVPTLIEPMTLAPGESRIIDIYVRPWGMCADGSCGGGKVKIDGQFSDFSDGFACAGFIAAADTTAPPTFEWPDAGSAIGILPPIDPPLGIMTIGGTPDGMAGFAVDLLPIPEPQLTVNGDPFLTGQVQLFTELISPNHGRTQVQFIPPPSQPFNVDSFFDVVFEITVEENPTGDPVNPVVTHLHHHAGAPTGAENTAPFGVGRVDLQNRDTGNSQGLFELMPQLSAVGINSTGERIGMFFELIEMFPRPDGTGFIFHVAGQMLPSKAQSFQAFELSFDMCGFASLVPQGGFIFQDSFESGNTSAWSNDVQ